MGFFKSLFKIAAPIVGTLLGGPVGAAIGGGLSGLASGGGIEGALKGALGSYAGATIAPGISSLFQGAGTTAGTGLSAPASFGTGFSASAPASSSLFSTAGESLLRDPFDVFAGIGEVGSSGGSLSPSIYSLSQGGVGGLDAGQGLAFGPLDRLLSASAGLSAPGGTFPAPRAPQFALPDAARSALKWAGPVTQIAGALEGRRQARQLQRQMELPSPGDVTQLPGYQAGLEAVRRTMASQGYGGSGNMMAALAKYGGDFYNQAVDQRVKVANAQAGPASAGISSLALLSSGLQGLAGVTK